MLTRWRSSPSSDVLTYSERVKDERHRLSQHRQVRENVSWKSIRANVNLLHVTAERCVVTPPHTNHLVYTCTRGVTCVDNLINFFLVWLLLLLSLFCSPSSSFHLGAARRELDGRRKTEKWKSEKKRGWERERSDFHSTLDHWSGV